MLWVSVLNANLGGKSQAGIFVMASGAPKNQARVLYLFKPLPIPASHIVPTVL